jgi:hypothetical protein
MISPYAAFLIEIPVIDKSAFRVQVRWKESGWSLREIEREESEGDRRRRPKAKGDRGSQKEIEGGVRRR